MRVGGSLFFTDANLLLYAIDKRDARKQRRAVAWIGSLWAAGSGCLSWQVLHEYYWNATRKLGHPSLLARSAVGNYCDWRPVEASRALVERAWAWYDEAGLAYWDALIVAAAERCEADYLLSEDFQAGRQFGACTVLNPFAADPDAYLPSPDRTPGRTS